MSNNEVSFRIVSKVRLDVNVLKKIFNFPTERGHHPSKIRGRDGEILEGELINLVSTTALDSPRFPSTVFYHSFYFILHIISLKNGDEIMFSVHSGNLPLSENSEKKYIGEKFANFIVDYFSFICSTLGRECAFGAGDLNYVFESYDNDISNNIGHFWLNFVSKEIKIDYFFPNRNLEVRFPWFRTIPLENGKVLISSELPYNLV